LAVAPTYLDSEFGFNHLLGENTDALLRDLCNVGPEDLRRLRREGVT
jgi:hypothetical protein